MGERTRSRNERRRGSEERGKKKKKKDAREAASTAGRTRASRTIERKGAAERDAQSQARRRAIRAAKGTTRCTREVRSERATRGAGSGEERARGEGKASPRRRRGRTRVRAPGCPGVRGGGEEESGVGGAEAGGVSGLAAPSSPTRGAARPAAARARRETSRTRPPSVALLGSFAPLRVPTVCRSFAFGSSRFARALADRQTSDRAALFARRLPCWPLSARVMAFPVPAFACPEPDIATYLVDDAEYLVEIALEAEHKVCRRARPEKKGKSGEKQRGKRRGGEDERISEL